MRRQIEHACAILREALDDGPSVVIALRLRLAIETGERLTDRRQVRAGIGTRCCQRIARPRLSTAPLSWPVPGRAKHGSKA
jgi:hypothetical protein